MPNVQMGLTLPLEQYLFIEKRADAKKVKKGVIVREMIEAEMKREKQ